MTGLPSMSGSWTLGSTSELSSKLQQVSGQNGGSHSRTEKGKRCWREGVVKYGGKKEERELKETKFGGWGLVGEEGDTYVVET